MKNQAPEEEATKLAENIAGSLSGWAMWPRITLDEKEEIVIDSHGPLGEPKESYWRTVLSLTAPAPVPARPGSIVRLDTEVFGPMAIDQPGRYKFHTKLTPK